MSSIDFETFRKKEVDFSNENIVMAMDVTYKSRGSYINDIEHKNAKYNDDNLLIIVNSDNEYTENTEYNDKLRELKDKVIEKMSKRYYAKI